jgi:DivIVA domain-containing protein
MASDITPDALRSVQFRSALRGADRNEVRELLERLASRIEILEGELVRSRERSDAAETSDLESEFEAVGQEVAAILQAAREASETMRERASIDAARWRTEAIAEAEAVRRQSSSDAEALRRDAWVTGTELIAQAQEYAGRIIEQADRDVLNTMGEAEREAHRLTSAARRDAEDLVRNATMTAEQMMAEATRRRDEMIDAATRQASTAQERTHALEKRRDELLEELEHARDTLNRLEVSLEERRESFDADHSSTVRVVPAPAADTGERPWESGETVRVVKPEPRREPDPVEAPRRPSSEVASRPSPQPEPEPEAAPEPAPEPVGGKVDEPAAPPVEGPEKAAVDSTSDTESLPGGADDVDSLFASLRSGGQFDEPESADEGAGGPEAAAAPKPDSEPSHEESEGVPETVDGTDWIEERNSRLLPITNRALRGIKKSITEMQNIALDNLRTDGGWRPDPKADAELLAADLITVWAESFAAGHSVAEQMSGGKLKRPATPHSNAVDEFPAALSQEVSDALDEAGGGQRERQSAASRVYRVWRSDEAEQRVRALAITAYQQAVELSGSDAD